MSTAPKGSTVWMLETMDELRAWLVDMLDRNQIVHEVDRAKAREWVTTLTREEKP